MSDNSFQQQVRHALGRVNDLQKRAGEQAAPPAHLLPEALEELSTTLEELHVAEEELRAQNEELLAARDIADAERHRYQDLFQLAPEGYLVTDLEGIIQ